MSDDPTHPALPENPELIELRGRLRGQWKAQRRTEEREALREHWLQRDLIGALAEAMRRGDHITFTLPAGRTLTGHVIGVGSDYALLHEHTEPMRQVAVRLANTNRHQAGDPYAGPYVVVDIHRSATSQPPVSSAANPLPTFQAVLHQYDFEQQAHPDWNVELGTSVHPRGLVCRLAARAPDHLYVQPPHSDQTLIPLAALTYIAWARVDDRLPD